MMRLYLDVEMGLRRGVLKIDEGGFVFFFAEKVVGMDLTNYFLRKNILQNRLSLFLELPL